MDTLRWMASDPEADFAESMGEIGMSVADAARLKEELTATGYPSGAVAEATPSDASPPDAPGQTAAAATPAPPAKLPTEPPAGQPRAAAQQDPARTVPDATPQPPPPLLNKRVCIIGLTGRPELNGKHGIATSWKDESGRYAVTLDAPIGVGMTVNVKPDNIQLPSAHPSRIPAPTQPTTATLSAHGQAASAAEVKRKGDDLPWAKGDFRASERFTGARPGYVFRLGDYGQGYYRDAVGSAGASALVVEPAAGLAPRLVPVWTPDGPRMVPAGGIRKPTEVMETLTALSKAKQYNTQRPGGAVEDPEQSGVEGGTTAGSVAAPDTAVDDAVLSALASVEALSQGKLTKVGDRLAATLAVNSCADSPLAQPGPKPAVVRERTQINHVAEHSKRIVTSKNPALEAYTRRLVSDPTRPEGKEGTLKCEGDMGTMNRKQEPEPEPQPTAPAICRYCEGKGPYAGGKCDECE